MIVEVVENPFVEFLKQKNCANSEILKRDYTCKDLTYISKLSKKELEVVVYDMMYNLQNYLHSQSILNRNFETLYDYFKESIKHLHIFHEENENEIKFKHRPF